MLESNRPVNCIAYALIPILFAPLHFRITYILFKNDEFRKLQCYRLMLHIQLFTCLMLPFYPAFGLTLLLKDPLMGATKAFSDLTAAVMEGINGIDFVLALNRLKLMFNLRYSPWIDTVLLIVAWLRSAQYFGLSVFGLLGTFLSDDFLSMELVTEGDFQHFYGLLDTAIFLAHSGATLVLYVILVVYLLVRKFKNKTVAIPSREKPILLQAVIRFGGELFISAVYMTLFSLDTTGMDRSMTIVLARIRDLPAMVNYVCLPPILYLALNRRMRVAIFTIPKQTTVISLS